MSKKTLLAGLMAAGLALTATSCYEPTLEYEAINTGQLQAPKVSRNLYGGT